MSNYEEKARSNYFKVKDKEKFKEFLKKYYLELIENNGLVGFIAHEGVPMWDNHTDEEIDFMGLLSKHLEKGEVAIVTDIGEEGFRHLSGYAVGINSRGRRVEIDLYDIYEKVKKLTKTPENITRAEY